MQFTSGEEEEEEEEGGRSSCKPVLGYPVSNPFNLTILKQGKYLRSYPSATHIEF
jgi:hypothetical protein